MTVEVWGLRKILHPQVRKKFTELTKEKKLVEAWRTPTAATANIIELFKETLLFKVPQGFESKGEDENPLNNQSYIKLELIITKKNTQVIWLQVHNFPYTKTASVVTFFACFDCYDKHKCYMVCHTFHVHIKVHFSIKYS